MAETDGDGLPRAVWLVAGGLGVVLLAVAGRYGWHRDELYFLEAGKHLDWGYIDQPPFTPLVARLAHEVAPGNLTVLRLAPALAAVAVVVLGALLVRELGGSRRAQAIGAGVTATSGFVVGAGHLLSTSTFDLVAWMAALVLVARLLRTDDPRWWLPFGAVAGASMLNKHLIVFLVASLAIGLVVERRWRLLLTPWAAAGALLALALAAPNLLWQAANGWPQLDMADALAERLAGENRATLVPLQVLFFGPFVVFLLWRGAAWLAGGSADRRYRPLLWAWPAGLVLTFVSAGRPYYVFPLTLAVGLAGVVATDRRGADRLVPLLAAGGAVSALIALPVLPLSSAGVVVALNETNAETIGWPELAAQVGEVVASVPAAERTRVIVLAASYGEAGALERHRVSHDLPPVFSGHNSYADFGRPDDDGATVVAVRYPAARLAEFFDDCRRVATVETPHDTPNEIQGTPIHVCRGLRGTWAEVWPRLRHLS